MYLNLKFSFTPHPLWVSVCSDTYRCRMSSFAGMFAQRQISCPQGDEFYGKVWELDLTEQPGYPNYGGTSTYLCGDCLDLHLEGGERHILAHYDASDLLLTATSALALELQNISYLGATESKLYCSKSGCYEIGLWQTPSKKQTGHWQSCDKAQARFCWKHAWARYADAPAELREANWHHGEASRRMFERSCDLFGVTPRKPKVKTYFAEHYAPNPEATRKAATAALIDPQTLAVYYPQYARLKALSEKARLYGLTENEERTAQALKGPVQAKLRELGLIQ